MNALNTRPCLFFGLVFLFSLPFWALAQFYPVFLMPGLPVSALMVVAPLLAAAVLVAVTGGQAGLTRLLCDAVDLSRITPLAWVMSVITMPLIALACAIWLLLTGETLLAFTFTWAHAVLLFALFLLAALAEEIGWMGYAYGGLELRYGVLMAALWVGLISALWHLIPLLQANRSFLWIAAWGVASLARRVLLVWLYRYGGRSVFAVSVCHAMSNLSWQLFPEQGSHYDPAITAAITAVLALAAVLHHIRVSKNTTLCLR